MALDYLTPNWTAPSNVAAKTYFCKKEKPESLVKKLSFNHIILNQTHSNIAIKATQITNSIKEITGDSIITTKHNLLCGILTADCLPILIANIDGSEIAAIHAGWRGLATNIITNTLNNMKSHKENIIAWIGPGISQKHFEVKENVYNTFIKNNIIFKQAFNKKGENIYNADLYKLAYIELIANGIDKKNIFYDNYCTYSNAKLFHSYRRDGIHAGRMLTLIIKYL